MASAQYGCGQLRRVARLSAKGRPALPHRNRDLSLDVPATYSLLGVDCAVFRGRPGSIRRHRRTLVTGVSARRVIIGMHHLTVLPLWKVVIATLQGILD